MPFCIFEIAATEEFEVNEREWNALFAAVMNPNEGVTVAIVFEAEVDVDPDDEDDE